MQESTQIEDLKTSDFCEALYWDVAILASDGLISKTKHSQCFQQIKQFLLMHFFTELIAVHSRIALSAKDMYNAALQCMKCFVGHLVSISICSCVGQPRPQ